MGVKKATRSLLIAGTAATAFLLFATAGAWAQNFGASVPSATGLSADGKGSSPHNVQTYTPMLSWQFTDADAGDAQTAYRIRVGTTPGANDLWDVTQTSATSTRMYAGTALAANTTYYWSVQVWDRASQPSVAASATFAVMDIGLRLFDGTSAIKIAADDNYTAYKLRISKNAATYGIVLVDPSDSAASKIRIETASGIKALKMMVAPPPAIDLSSGNLGFSGISGGANPGAQTITVSNAGGGTLSGLTVTVSYGSGSGWLTASLNTTTAPATLTVTPSTSALAAGNYTATISVASGAASNSPQTVNVAAKSAIGRLAYVYSSDATMANGYKAFLEANNWLADIVAIGSVVGFDFSPDNFIVIGSDTGFLNDWGTPGEVSAIGGSGKKILGFGEGGYAFFGKLGLPIGFADGWHGNLTDVVVVDPSSSLFTTPNTVTIPSGNIIQVYTSAGSVGIYLPTIPLGIVVIGREVADANHYDILRQGTNDVLWGYSAPAGNLTATGTNLLLNILYYLK